MKVGMAVRVAKANICTKITAVENLNTRVEDPSAKRTIEEITSQRICFPSYSN